MNIFIKFLIRIFDANRIMLVKKLQEYMRLKNYSRQTIKAYTNCGKVLNSHFKKPLREISKQEFEDFLGILVARNCSPYTINQYHAALKLIFEKIYKIPFNFNTPCADRIHKLPVVLSHRDISRIVNLIKNPRHKLIISLAYGAGLRISEVVSLKVKDINLEELTINLKNAKGKKDRINIFPEKIKNDIQNLITGKNSDYLFISERGGRLTERTAQKFFESALRGAGIKKDATFHSLRHSFARHLLENGPEDMYKNFWVIGVLEQPKFIPE